MLRGYGEGHHADGDRARTTVGINITLIERNPNDWDADLRRAEANHALDQREAATLDYRRRLRCIRRRRSCIFGGAVITTHAGSAMLRCAISKGRLQPECEIYSLQPGVYAGCPDSAYRDPQSAIATAQRAVDLDPSRPTLLSILAAAYASAGDRVKAVAAQKQALARRDFPLGLVRMAKANSSNTSGRLVRNSRSTDASCLKQLPRFEALKNGVLPLRR